MPLVLTRESSVEVCLLTLCISVDFWFLGFDVYFGSQPAGPPLLHLHGTDADPGFYEVCAKAGPPSTPVATDDDSKDLLIQLKFNVEDGSFPMPTKDDPNQPDPKSTGPGTKWFVKGGGFKCRISSVFAISTAALETENSLSQHDPSQRQPVAEVYGAKSQAQSNAMLPLVDNVFSVPMGVSATKIVSPITITITEKENDKISEGWTPRYIFQNVPRALWDASPPDGNDGSDPTIPLAMAIALEAPPPRLAVSKIPAFDATAAASRQVDDPTRLMNPEADQSIFRPATLASTPADYPSMQTAWEKAASDADLMESVVNACMTTLGWDKPSVDVQQAAAGKVPKPWQLTASFPKRLVSGTKVAVTTDSGQAGTNGESAPAGESGTGGQSGTNGQSGKGKQEFVVEEGLFNMYMALPRVTVGALA
jgi:hypothetical protein